MNTSAEALRLVVSKAEDAGVMVMSSSVVGSNSHRKLQVEEFRGFTLADAIAPLVFINGADSKSAQLFTIVHELAHLWLGESGVIADDFDASSSGTVERWCNQVTAEFLVPMGSLQTQFIPSNVLPDEIKRLARSFNVSTLVIVRRLLDATLITHEFYIGFYNNEVKRYANVADYIKGGGDFYRSLATRTSKRFARAVLSSTLEGMTSFTEAYHLLGIRKTSTFYKAAKKLEVIV